MDSLRKKFLNRVEYSNDSKPLDYLQRAFEELSLGHSIEMRATGPLRNSKTGTYLSFETGGTAGRKKILHSDVTIQASVDRFSSYFGSMPIHSLCCLPLYHVGGWMQVERSFRSNGSLCFMNYKELMNMESFVGIKDRFLSLVPAQLFELVRSKQACHNLRYCKAILVGGGALSESLAEKARDERLPIYNCYGMTETAGLITVLDKKKYFSGIRGVGRVMDGVEMQLCELNRIKLKCNSLGYDEKGVPLGLNGWFKTFDVGQVNSNGLWKILHRLDRLINSGGKKIMPEMIEKKILAFPEVECCLVVGKSDPKWGERIVAYVTPQKINLEELKKSLERKLTPFEMPKEWHKGDALPTNEMGKPQIGED